jgi:hypothetical protein
MSVRAEGGAAFWPLGSERADCEVATGRSASGAERSVEPSPPVTMAERSGEAARPPEAVADPPCSLAFPARDS